MAAFLHGKELKEEVFMEQPEGFKDPSHPNHVCKLILTLHGLHQSARHWNEKVADFLVNLGMHQSQHDPSFFILLNGETLQGLITIHMDEIAIAGTDEFLSSFIKSLKSWFHISSETPPEQHLSICISCSADLSHFNLNQQTYIEKLKSQFFGEEETPTARTPYVQGFNTLVPASTDEDSNLAYNSLIGALLWLAQCTRPDISFAVNRLSQFLKKITKVHFNAAL